MNNIRSLAFSKVGVLSVAIMLVFFAMGSVVNGLTAEINGEKVDLDEEGALRDGEQDIQMVPVRLISEKLGAYVAWDGEQQEVYIEDKGAEARIVLTIGEQSYQKNDQVMEMEIAPLIQEKRTQVPLQFVSEALDARFYWDGDDIKIERSNQDRSDIYLDLASDVFEKSDEITFDIINDRDTEITFARMFDLEYNDEDNKKWQTVDLDMQWIQDMVMLESGNSHSQTFTPEDIFAHEVREGQYRVNKQVRCFESDEEFNLTAKFEIVKDQDELKQPSDVSLNLDEELYTVDEEIEIMVKNTGDRTISTGYPFNLEQYVDGEWEEVFLDMVWPEVMLYLEPGESLEQEFVFSEGLKGDNMTEGKYRLSKTISYQGEDETMKISEDFEIVTKEDQHKQKYEEGHANSEDVSYSYDEGVIKLDWGTKNTGGYSITIQDFSLEDRLLIVNYKLVSPGEDSMVPQVITNPTDTKTVPEEFRDFDKIGLNLLEHDTL